MTKQRIIVGISGATGAIYGIRLLEILKQIESIEVHLVISNAAHQTISHETDYQLSTISSLADVYHPIEDIGASISSGSFHTLGMIVLPCSIKTLSGIANSYSDNLLIRAADVCLKEQRKLVLCVRETPLHEGHLELMLKSSRIGATIMPLMPAFYHQPKSVEQLIDQSIARVLDQFNLKTELFKRWGA